MKLYGLFSITPTFNNTSYTTHVTDAVIPYKTRYYNLGTTGYYNFGTGYPYLSVNIRKIIRLMNEVRDIHGTIV